MGVYLWGCPPHSFQLLSSILQSTSKGEGTPLLFTLYSTNASFHLVKKQVTGNMGNV